METLTSEASKRPEAPADRTRRTAVAAVAARDIRKAEVGSGIVVVMTRFGDEEQVRVEDLSNVELNRACSIAFPQLKGNRWLGVSGDLKREALNTGQIPPSSMEKDPTPMQATGWCAECGTEEGRHEAGCKFASAAAAAPAIPVAVEPQTTNNPPAVIETPVAAPANGYVPPAGSLEATILDLVTKAGIVGGVDEEQVRRIANDVLATNVAELLNEVSRPQVTHINLPARPEPVILEGRQHAEFDKVLRLVSMGCNVWLTGPAGTGKTKLAENVAKALELPFYTLSCDPTMQRSTMFGFVDAGGTYRPTLYREARENGGLFLLDEIDNSHPSIVAGMNQGLSSGLSAFPDGMVQHHAKSCVIAAANTFGTGPTDEYVGRMKLDAATLNRFFRVFIGTDEDLERDLVTATITDRDLADRWLKLVRKHRENASNHKLRIVVSMRDAVDGATAIEGGFSIAEVADMRWLAGLGEDDKRKVSGS